MTTLLRKFITVFFVIVIVLGIGLSALFATLSLTGSFNVSGTNSSSMSPSINYGSWVISKKVPSSSILNGDVVVIPSANSSNITVIGRVVSVMNTNKEGFYYQLKGDSEILPNEWSYKVGNFTYKQIFTIPLIGILANPIIITIFGLLIITIALAYTLILHKPKAEPLLRTEAIETNPEWTAVDEIKSIFGEKNND